MTKTKAETMLTAIQAMADCRLDAGAYLIYDGAGVRIGEEKEGLVAHPVGHLGDQWRVGDISLADALKIASRFAEAVEERL